MAFSLNFKNLGHYFAVGAKYLATGVKDVLLFANKAQAVAPEVDALVLALAGPAGAKISDLAFHVLGSAAAAVTPLGADAAAQVSSQGLSLSLDLQTILDIKAAATQIEALIKSIGGTKPTP